ncbi:MAG: HEAT repeat domain-containing protein [Pyrinomonadaceae bacterium]
MPKLFFLAFLLCLSLFVSGQSQVNNSANLLKQILDLPAPAPVNREEKTETKKERDEKFFADANAPSDDAPIEDLVDYWSNKNGGYNRLKYQLKPSDKVLGRLLDYCEDNPDLITNFLTLMPTKPDIAEKVKNIYDRLAQDDENSYIRTTVQQWLKFNSKYYVDELIREAQKIEDRNNYVQNEDQAILRALAKVDWDSARPIIDRLELDSNQPYAQILAKWVIYQHAIDTEDSSLTERYRGELQKIVEDKKAAWAQRDLAMDSLVMSDGWKGRDEWYVSLLEDETLLTIQDNGYTGLTTLIAMSPPDKWIDTMIKLAKSSNLAVRSAAVRNLMDVFNKDRKDVVEALLPWLSNPDWAKSSNRSERSDLITALAEIDMPEAVPGLIWVVQNESENNRAQAAKALVKNKNAGAIPALRIALQDEKNEEYRKNIIEALIACGGIGDDEQMASLEAYATVISTPEGLERMQNYDTEAYEEESEQPKKPMPLPVIIGKFVSEQEEPSDGLAARAVERLKILRKTKPAVAKTLAEIMQKWKGRAIYLETLRQIKTGEAEIDTILNLLANRKNVREKIPNDISALRTVNGASRGIGACLAEDAGEYLSILGQTDAETQIAMLGCARMLRAQLPVNEVSELLKSANQTLALAAERYLESEDSVQARTLVLARHPNEAVILGAHNAFIPREVKKAYESPALDALFLSVTESYYVGGAFPEIKRTEDGLRGEITQNADMLAVYAMLPEAESGQQILRVFKDRAVFTSYEDTARFKERNLTAEEYERFYNFLIENRIDGFSAFTDTCEECAGSDASEFVMFGRGGGRRVFFMMPVEGNKVIDKLKEFFASFAEGEMNLHYKLSEKIKGLEVILSDKNFEALSVWKKDGDFRVLVEDKIKKEEIEKDLNEREKTENSVETDDAASEVAQKKYEAQAKRRRDAAYAHFFWRKVEGGKLGDILPQPSEAAFLPDDISQIAENSELNPSPRAWQVRSGNFEIRVDSAEGNLYKSSRAQSPVKIKNGSFSNPIVTGDGKWVVVSKVETDSSEPNGVARVNVQTGAEFKINLPAADTFLPIAFVPAQNKVLLYRAKGKFYREEGELIQYDADGEYNRPQDKTKPNPSPKIPEYYLLDAATGAIQLVKGEFRPLAQQTYRPLQPTANPNEFWAAVYDEKTRTTQIGRYSDKTFSLQAVLSIPNINLNSMQIWVDEKEAKVYFVYQGHLLALPLK